MLKLLKNKKVMAAVTTAIVATGAKLGLDIDDEYVALIITAGVAVIGALAVGERKAKPPTGAS